MPRRAMTIRELRGELRKKVRLLQGVFKQRKKLLNRLAALDRRIIKMGGEVPAAGKVGAVGRGRRRPAGRASGKPLAAYIKEVLARNSSGMRAKDITTAVTKAGYKSYSSNFYGIVAAALQDKTKYKRVGRGAYILK